MAAAKKKAARRPKSKRSKAKRGGHVGCAGALTKKVREEICFYIKTGSFRETACARVGIDARTLRTWLRKAAEAEEAGRTNRYTLLAREMDKAAAELETLLSSGILAAGGQDWRALAHLLERMFRSRWGFKAGLEVSAPGGGPLLSGVVVLPAKEPLPGPTDGGKAHNDSGGDGGED